LLGTAACVVCFKIEKQSRIYFTESGANLMDGCRQTAQSVATGKGEGKELKKLALLALTVV
jgi:hypothetical protein